MAAWPQSAETTGVGWAPGGVLTLQAESWCHDANQRVDGVVPFTSARFLAAW